MCLKKLMICALILLSWTGIFAEAPPLEYAERYKALDLFQPKWEEARKVDEIAFTKSGMEFKLQSGWLIPSQHNTTNAAEYYFYGEGTFTASPQSATEAQQIELFTGTNSIEETFKWMAFAMFDDETIATWNALPRTEDATTLKAELERPAVDWSENIYRNFLHFQEGLTVGHFDNRTYEQAFSAFVMGDQFENIIINHEPSLLEQTEIMQFKPIDLDEEEERKVSRVLHKMKRKGKLGDLDPEQIELGTFDTWTNYSDPKLGEGGAIVEPLKYTIDASLDPKNRSLSATVTLVLRALEQTQSLTLSLNSNLTVESVVDSDGREWFHRQRGNTIYVLADSPVTAGADFELTVKYAGDAFTKIKNKVLVLDDPTGWYPTTGTINRATYDVTLRAKKSFMVLAQGKRVEQGLDKNIAWQRFLVDRSVLGYTFEIGDFETTQFAAGPVAVTLAFNRLSDDCPRYVKDDIIESIKSSLAFYSETFGDYPLDHLTVVSSPRPYSQGYLGFVTISDLYFLSNEATRYYGFEDRGLIVAHEIAHQWWGNLVGWKSYRDLWVSEAMAEYSALLWAKDHRPKKKRSGPSLLDSWQDRLTRVLPDGRVVESIGPMTLGTRLNSRYTSSAYDSIVYRKGGVVLNTLENYFSEGDLPLILKELVRVSSGKIISTDTFIAILEQASGTKLDWFQNQFIENTGLPEIYYEYEFVELGEGEWQVKGTVTQQTPYRFDYQPLIKDGSVDVQYSVVDQLDVSEFKLPIPVTIGIHDPSRLKETPEAAKKLSNKMKKASKSRKDDSKQNGKSKSYKIINGVINSRLILEGGEENFTMNIKHEPVQLWFDKQEEVFGRFFSKEQTPKRYLFYRGLDQLVANNYDEALSLFKESLAQEANIPNIQAADSIEELVSQINQYFSADYFLDADIKYWMATIHLNRGELDKARTLADEIHEHLKKYYSRKRSSLNERLLRARIALKQGNYEEVKDVLTLKRGKKMYYGSRQGLAMLASAAYLTGDEDLKKKLRRRIEAAGIDLSGLSAQTVGAHHVD